ncbi:MAG TPA: hypothetical protein DG753_02525 [Clostridium sp.]|nr:hypothetical protein [Clostridium sp.]
MRRHFIDNIKSLTILLVVIYHSIYIFNSAGVYSNINVKGIPYMDMLLYFVYPWFMCLMFVLAGVCARYSLQKRTKKEFINERIRKLVLPSTLGVFLISWINGFITSKYVDVLGGIEVPGIIKYFVYCLIGIGPLWFLHELFLASMILILIRKIDKDDNIYRACAGLNIVVIMLLFIAVWGSSFIFNASTITVYRNGIYILMFLFGYYIFSNNSIQVKLGENYLPIIITSLIMGFAYVWYYFGTDYTSNTCLTSFFTNLYLWFMVLAIIGYGKRHLEFDNKFTQFLNKRSFGIYVLHYPVMLCSAYILTTYFNMPMFYVYILVFLSTIIITLICYELLKRIPGVRLILFGIKKLK